MHPQVFKVLSQENNSFITVLLVSPPRSLTSVEDKEQIWLDDARIFVLNSLVSEYDQHDVSHTTAPCKTRDYVKAGAEQKQKGIVRRGVGVV